MIFLFLAFIKTGKQFISLPHLLQILAKIFQFLDRTNLNNCRLTCRQWREESLPIFREKVRLILSHLTRGERTYCWESNDLHMNFWGCNPDLFQNTEITSSFCNSVRSMTAQKFIMKPFPTNNGISFRFCDYVRDLRLDGETLCELIPCKFSFKIFIHSVQNIVEIKKV